VNVTAGHVPVDAETAPVRVVGGTSATLVATTEPSACLVPVTVTLASFFVASAQVVDGKVVELLTVTFVLCTVNVTAGQVPADAEINPVNVVGAGVVNDTLVANTEPSACLVPVTLTLAAFFVASAHVVDKQVSPLSTVTCVPCTVTVRAAHAPAEAETTPH